jgi:RNA polymerase sigma-70 factor (ECF subfamily)
MSDGPDFTEFVRRIRAGDADAAAELVRRFEPIVRREVRLHFTDSRLRRVIDSADVCQSVLASFFVRAAAGGYDLDDPARLAGLLVRMARNKLATAARAQTRQRRDCRRAASGEGLDATAAPGPTPSRVVAGRELLDRFRELLSPEERALADLRGQGLGWAEVAARVGGTPEACRVRLARAVRRATEALGLDDDPPDADPDDRR